MPPFLFLSYTPFMQEIAHNLEKIRRRVAVAAQNAGGGSVELIAVSKFQPVEALVEALRVGQRLFGENRVQEAKKKFPVLREQYPDLELHLIGALQTNKAEEAVSLFDVIQTIDRPNLAEAIARAIAKIGRRPRLYLEVNIGNEPQKAGVLPEKLDEFLSYCRQECRLSIEGLMCIPPHGEAPESFFRRLKQLADRHHLRHVSMGMSMDFEVAIACGATEVRVGTAIFGERSEVKL